MRRGTRAEAGRNRTTTGTDGRTRHVTALLALGIAVATVAAYARVAGFGFTSFDDLAYVAENPHVRAGLTPAGLRWAFGMDPVTGNWHPLTWLSLMADASLFGASAAGFHLVNLLLHVASALLLLAFLAGTTGRPLRAAFVAALFALHPLHVESVAWVSERKDVLSTLFLMLTLLAYARHARRPGAGRYLVALAAFALGLLAKAMLVSVPLLLLLLDAWPLRRVTPGPGGAGCFPPRPPGRLLLEKLPFAALAVASGLVTRLAQAGGGNLASLEVVPLGLRVANAVMSYGLYLANTFWPAGLACYYPYPRAWPPGAVLAVLLALAAVTVVAARGARRWPYLAVGWLWYAVTLAPVVGLVQIGLQARADRYTYVPLIGIFVVVAWGLPDLLAARRGGRGLARALPAAGLAVLAALGVLTWRQAGHWKDSASLYSRALAVTKDNWFAHHGMGFTLKREAERLADAGEAGASRRRYEESAVHFREATRILPQFAEAHSQLGSCLGALGDPDGARAELERTLALAPRHAGARNNLANLLLRQGRAAEAVPHYREALRLEPGLAGAHFNLAVALVSLGRLDEAAREYRAVLALDAEPYFAYWARTQLALLLHRGGATAEAIRLLEQAVRLNEATGVDPAAQTARASLESLRGKR